MSTSAAVRLAAVHLRSAAVISLLLVPPHRLLWHHPAGEHCFALEAEEVER